MGVRQLASVNTIDCLAEMCEKSRQIFSSERDGTEEGLICPKPRRVMMGLCSTSSIGRPLPKLRSQVLSVADGEAENELLDILFSKGSVAMGHISPSVSSSSSSSLTSSLSSSPPAYFCGSPPSRVGNPLIHDVQFRQNRNFPLPFVQQEAPSPLYHCSSFGVSSPSMTTKKVAASSFPFSSCSSHGATPPSVRIEGFAASSPDTNRGVPALA